VEAVEVEKMLIIPVHGHQRHPQMAEWVQATEVRVVLWTLTETYSPAPLTETVAL